MRVNELIAGFKGNLYMAKERGWDPWVIYVQACLETGNFTSDLAQKFNFWGIKSWKGCKWPLYTKPSPEGDCGKLYISDFIVLPQIYTAHLEYMRLIQNYHPKTFAARADYKEYYKWIHDWSTSSTYTEDLIKLYERMEWEGLFAL